MEKEMLICYTSLIFCDYFHPKSCLPTIRGNISSCATFCMEFFDFYTTVHLDSFT